MTLAEVLAPFDMSEGDLVESLAYELRIVPDLDASRLSEAEAGVLAVHGGIATPVDDEHAVVLAMLRSTSGNLAAQIRGSLSVEQAAKLLRVGCSQVWRQIRDRAVYAFRIGSSFRLPTWQVEGHQVIPGLRAVLAALPAELHPLEVAGFMTTPHTDLAATDEPTSPRDWLARGGAVKAVIQLVEQLNTW